MKTQKEFLAALRNERNGWRILRDGEIRRGRARYRYCPITAVVKTMTGTNHGIIYPGSAGKSIGMPDDLISQIIDAADWPLVRGVGISRLRNRMLAALGLTA